MDKKNTMLLTVIAVATLLVAVVGATFAYFSVTGENTAGTTAITGEAQDVGSVALSGGGSLGLYVTAAEMAQSLGGTTHYYAVENFDASTNPHANSAQHAKVATATVTDAGDATYYCRFTLNVDKTTNTTMNPVSGDAGLILTLGGDAQIAGVTSGAEIDHTQVATSYVVNFTMTKANTTPLDVVTAAAVLHNTTANQSTNIAGLRLGYSLSVATDSFRCDTAALS